MNCQNHPEVPATAYCRSCGKPVCDECRRDALGTVYCAEHVPIAAAPPPPPQAAAPGPVPGAAMPPVPQFAYPDISPGLAFFLGWIPGVGAIYNAQYAKGLVHAVVWGILVSLCDAMASSGTQAVFVMLTIAWTFYMAFEAYHTARKRRAGEPVDEYSSILDLRGRKENIPVAGIALVVLGVLMLLHTLDLLNFERVARYWPILLIAAGLYLLYGRFVAHDAQSEVRHERQ